LPSGNQSLSLTANTESFNASANLIQHLKKHGFNPTDPDANKRVEAAEKKWYSQLI
jgi:hypothetical protein